MSIANVFQTKQSLLKTLTVVGVLLVSMSGYGESQFQDIGGTASNRVNVSDDKNRAGVKVIINEHGHIVNEGEYVNQNGVLNSGKLANTDVGNEKTDLQNKADDSLDINLKARGIITSHTELIVDPNNKDNVIDTRRTNRFEVEYSNLEHSFSNSNPSVSISNDLYKEHISGKIKYCRDAIDEVQNVRLVNSKKKEQRNRACFSEVQASASGDVIASVGVSSEDGLNHLGQSKEAIVTNSYGALASNRIANICLNAAEYVSDSCDINKTREKGEKTLKEVVSIGCGQIREHYSKRSKAEYGQLFNYEKEKECQILKSAARKYEKYYSEKLKYNKKSSGSDDLPTNAFHKLATEVRGQAKQSILAVIKANKIKTAVAVAAVGGTGAYLLSGDSAKDKAEKIAETVGAVDTSGDGVADTVFSDTCVTTEANYHLNPACETLFISSCGSVTGAACSQFHTTFCGPGAKGDGSNFCTFQASVAYCRSGSSGSPACGWLRNQDLSSCSINLLDANCLPPAGSSISLSDFNSSCGFFPDDPLCASHNSGALITRWSVLGETAPTTNVASADDTAAATESTSSEISFTSSSVATRTIASIDLPKDIIQASSGVNLGTSVVNLYCATGKLADCD